MASCNLAGCVDLPAHNVAVCMVESTPDLVQFLAKAELAELEGFAVLFWTSVLNSFPRLVQRWLIVSLVQRGLNL